MKRCPQCNRIALDPNNARAYQWNGSRLMMIGLYDESLASYDRAIEIEPTLAELGEKEAAIASLNEAATKGDYWFFSIKYDPAFDPLRSDPRFQELLKKFNPPKI